MTLRFRPARSLLFVPAANARALEKSRSLRADALIFDLEDSAAPAEKDAARERLRARLEGPPAGDGPVRILRINRLDTREGTEDFLMARAVRPEAILLPKLESVAELHAAEDALAQSDAPAGIALLGMIETPLGILRVEEIAAASRAAGRLSGLVLGPNDIALSTGVRPGPERLEMLPWLMRVVLAAKAYGLDAFDGVYRDFRDAEGFARECAAGRRMGFTGKTLIHPAQIEPANRAFSPSEAETEEARAIVAAFADPRNAGRGVIPLGGRMVERLHLIEAEALLADIGSRAQSQ